MNASEVLKVGDSFEVVEVLDPNEYSIDKNVFKKGGHSLRDGHTVLINGNSGLFKGKDKYLYLNETRRKLIGKLTITKLK